MTSPIFLFMLVAAQTPPVTVPEGYAIAPAGQLPAEPWWSDREAELRDLIENVLAKNYDLHGAVERMVQADAVAIQSRSVLFPSLSLEASASVAPTESRGFQFGGLGGPADGPSVFYSGSASLSARYQLDIFGRNYLAYSAARLQALASAGDRDAIALALVAQLGSAYHEVAAAREQLVVIEAQVEANESFLELVQLRFERGESSGLDVLQQKQQLAATKARVPAAKISLRIARQRLATLTGIPATEYDMPTLAAVPEVEAPPGAGAPVDLVGNRPDLRAASSRWESASERSRSSFQAHLPTLSVNGNIGYQLFRLDETRTQDFWGAGVNFSLPLFSGFGDVARVRQASAAEAEALATLNQSVLNALQEVEAAATRDAELREQLTLLQEQQEAARLAWGESKLRYENGLTNYLQVLTALSAHQQVQLTVIQTKLAAINARIALHHALGGPWTEGLGARGRESEGNNPS